MNPLYVFLGIWALSAICMTLLWLRQKRTQNAGTVDVAWAFGVGISAAALSLLASDGWMSRRILVASLALLWGCRLGLHLLRRMRADGHEDGRYARMRGTWGEKYDVRMFWFFQAQASWVLLFSVPMWAASTHPLPEWRILDGLGTALFAVSWIGAGIADRQLYRFKRRPDSKGQVCRVGLWAWSRHPNYFFEWIHWLGWTAIAVGSSLWWVPLLGAGVMLFFLLEVTGVPVTEKRAVESKGDAYRAYQREVSVFVPLPPRRSDSSPTRERDQQGEHSHG